MKSFAVKYVPEWVPGAGFQKIAREYRKSAMSLLNDPFQLVKDQMVSTVNRMTGYELTTDS